MSAVRCAAMAADGNYARSAARRYLDAYARQDGQAYTVACGMTYARNMLAKVALAGGLELDAPAGEWWGFTWKRYAEKILTQTT